MYSAVLVLLYISNSLLLFSFGKFFLFRLSYIFLDIIHELMISSHVIT